MSQDDPKIARLKAALTAAGPKPKRKRKPRASVEINGNSNIVGDGNVVLHSPRIEKKVVVKTGDGVIDAAQKAELRALIDQWVKARAAVRRGESTHAMAWSAFNNRFGINKYAELPMERFGEARRWLLKQIATIASMKSAPRKMPGWRQSRMRFIKAACKNDLGDPECYKPYIRERFGVESLAQLTDDQLQKTYLHIAGRKQRAKGV